MDKNTIHSEIQEEGTNRDNSSIAGSACSFLKVFVRSPNKPFYRHEWMFSLLRKKKKRCQSLVRVRVLLMKDNLQDNRSDWYLSDHAARTLHAGVEYWLPHPLRYLNSWGSVGLPTTQKMPRPARTAIPIGNTRTVLSDSWVPNLCTRVLSVWRWFL